MKEKNTLYFGWFIVGFSFITLALVYGVWYSFSVFFVALLKEFGWSRSIGAGAFSFLSSLAVSLVLMWEIWSIRLAPEKVIIWGSLLLGVGTYPLQLHADLVAILYLLQCHYSGGVGDQRGGCPMSSSSSSGLKRRGDCPWGSFLLESESEF